MRKRTSLTRSRSSYLIQPKAIQHKPLVEPLLSPFPPHVHRYLFSGREIRLCDRSGTSIERVAEAGLSARRQLDVITAKLERKPEEVRTTSNRKTLPTAPEGPNHPYHLTPLKCKGLRATRTCYPAFARVLRVQANNIPVQTLSYSHPN